MRRASLALLLLLGVFLVGLPLATARCGSCESTGPSSPAAQPRWLEDLKKMRSDSLAKVKYAGGVFDTPALAWTQTNYMQPQMHPYDRFFYDPAVGYTVDKYLNDLNARCGGVDSILMCVAHLH